MFEGEKKLHFMHDKKMTACFIQKPYGQLASARKNRTWSTFLVYKFIENPLYTQEPLKSQTTTTWLGLTGNWDYYPFALYKTRIFIVI